VQNLKIPLIANYHTRRYRYYVIYLQLVIRKYRLPALLPRTDPPLIFRKSLMKVISFCVVTRKPLLASVLSA
jgi:hypothetical protein